MNINAVEMSANNFAIVSDLHIGDPRCTLFNIMNPVHEHRAVPKEKGIYFSPETRDFYHVPHDYKIMKRMAFQVFYRVELDDAPGSQYHVLKQILADQDGLIILGDLFDLAVQRADIVYALVKEFLTKLVDDTGIKEIILVPGNHDYSLWRSLMWEIDVIDQVKKDRPAHYVKHVVPGVLDFRNGSSKLMLFGYDDTLNDASHPRDNSFYHPLKPNGIEYGGSHLDGLLGGRISIRLAYPNLYVIDSHNRITLLTHGQYFEHNWCAASHELIDHWGAFREFVRKTFGLSDEQLNEDPYTSRQVSAMQDRCQRLNLPQFVQINALVCNGQSGANREAGIPAEMEIIIRSLSVLLNKGEKAEPLSHQYSYISALIAETGEEIILDLVPDPYIRPYIKRTREEMQHLLKHCFQDQVPAVSYFIFGHTHLSGIANIRHTALGKDMRENITMGPEEIQENNYNTVNTGGWLRKDPLLRINGDFAGYADPCGASVPILHDGTLKKVHFLNEEATGQDSLPCKKRCIEAM